MLHKKEPGALGVRPRSRPVHCQECTIQIGDGYQESLCFEFLDDGCPPSPKVLQVCWRCWESLNRRKAKRLAVTESNTLATSG